MKKYIEQYMLNSDTLIKWPQEYINDFNGGKEWLLSLHDYLERQFMIKNGSLTYKAGNVGSDADLRAAVAFTIFSNALSCYISFLHLAWNGHITASAMLVRRIYELLVDLGFMLTKHTNRRLRRFVNMADVQRYQRLFYLYDDLSPRELTKALKKERGRSYDELRKRYMMHRRKYGYFKKEKVGVKVRSNYIFTGDWAFGLLKKNRRTTLREKAETIGLGDLHYKLSYGQFSAKSHPDAWDIASKADITDDTVGRVKYKILPDKEEHFRPVLVCGVQYMVAFFVIFANVFQIVPLDRDKDILEKTKKIREHQDYKEFFKKIKLKKDKISF